MHPTYVVEVQSSDFQTVVVTQIRMDWVYYTVHSATVYLAVKEEQEVVNWCYVAHYFSVHKVEEGLEEQTCREKGRG